MVNVMGPSECQYCSYCLAYVHHSYASIVWASAQRSLICEESALEDSAFIIVDSVTFGYSVKCILVLQFVSQCLLRFLFCDSLFVPDSMFVKCIGRGSSCG